MRRAKQLSFRDQRLHTGRGGPRVGAGRPARRAGIVHHVKRPPLASRHPVHVTLRVRRGVPSLRRRDFVRAFREALARGEQRGAFRVFAATVN